MSPLDTWHPGSARHRASGCPTAGNGWAGLSEAFRTRHPATFRWDAVRAVSRTPLTFIATLRWRALFWLCRVVRRAARKSVGHVSSTHLEAKEVDGRSKPVAWTPANTEVALVASQPVAIKARHGLWPARIRCQNLIHELDRSLFLHRDDHLHPPNRIPAGSEWGSIVRTLLLGGGEGLLRSPAAYEDGCVGVGLAWPERAMTVVR